MKRKLIVLLFLIFACLVYSQDYDLIVKSNGDSIACHIDSIADATIYFEMKHDKHWIHTNIKKEEVIDYKFSALDKKQVVFKPGSSYINIAYQDSATKQELKTYNPFGYQYLLGPTGYSMKKGETYYGTYGLFFHRFQHGFTNRFTMSFGAGFPFAGLIMANYSLPIWNYSVFSIHDAIILVPYGNRYGNWTFAQYTVGNPFNSFSLGAGVLLGKDKGSSLISPTINLSGQVMLTRFLYFMHETYYFNLYDERHYMQITDPDDRMVENQLSKNYAGITGLNFVFGKKAYNSLKVGALYKYTIHGAIPEGYEYSDTYQEEEEFGGWFLLIYSRKFRNKKVPEKE